MIAVKWAAEILRDPADEQKTNQTLTKNNKK